MSKIVGVARKIYRRSLYWRNVTVDGHYRRRSLANPTPTLKKRSVDIDGNCRRQLWSWTYTDVSKTGLKKVHTPTSNATSAVLWCGRYENVVGVSSQCWRHILGVRSSSMSTITLCRRHKLFFFFFAKYLF